MLPSRLALKRSVIMSDSYKKRGVQIFENPVLDWFSRAHPAIPAIIWIPLLTAAMAWGIYRGVVWWHAALLWLAGAFLWTLFEYILHRWIFHFVPENPKRRYSYYLVHQIHHDFDEWDRLVAPPMMSLSLGVIFMTLFWLLLGPVIMWPLFSGFIAGYLVYDYSHFFMHFRAPRTNFGKRLRRRHMQHHTAYPDRWFGVSSSFWDYVFRTHVKPGERPAKQAEVEWNRTFDDA